MLGHMQVLEGTVECLIKHALHISESKAQIYQKQASTCSKTALETLLIAAEARRATLGLPSGLDLLATP
jgi:hypothetical protein